MHPIDFHVFRTSSGSQYLYDVNTNTVHPLSDGIPEEVIRDIYAAQTADRLGALSEKYPAHQSFFRYATLWRSHTDAFRNHPPQEKTYLRSIAEAQKNQLITSLAWDLILITTEQCNMRCAYCVHEQDLYPNRRPHGSKSMSLETMRKAIDLYFAMNRSDRVRPFKNRALNIAFYGGEALLNFRAIREAVSYARESYDGPFELHLGISTNLTLFDPQWLPFLRDNEVSLSISLDGPQKEHDRYRRMKNGAPSFEILEKKLKMIHEFDGEYFKNYLSANITTNGNTQFMDVVRFFEEEHERVPKIQAISPLKDLETSHFHQMYPYDREAYIESIRALNHYFTSECLAGRQFVKGEALYAFTYNFVSDFYNSPHFISRRKNWYTGSCIPSRKITVTPDEYIHVCERVGTGRPVGDLDRGIDEEKILAYFNEFLASTDDCPKCWARNRCKICPAEVDSDSGDCYFENRCEQMRNNLNRQFVNVYSLLEQKPDLFAGEYEYF